MLQDIYYKLHEDNESSETVRLFEELGLQPAQGTEQPGTYILSFIGGCLCLSNSAEPKAAPTKVDFEDSALLHRLKTSGKHQGLAKAVGLDKYSSITAIDGTAGMGKDAFILAALGCQLTLLERNPIVHALLADGFRRAENADLLVRKVIERLNLLHSDTFQWCKEILSGKNSKVDVIYLDPMFPVRQKSAKVKKDMANLQHLLGPDEDLIEVLSLARKCVTKRVVVKRPSSAFDEKYQNSVKPAYTIGGKSILFDVFLPDAASKTGL